METAKTVESARFEELESQDVIAWRREVFWVENDAIGDAPFTPLMVQTLRELADWMELDGGRGATPKVFESSNGTRVTFFWGSWLGDVVRCVAPRQPPA